MSSRIKLRSQQPLWKQQLVGKKEFIQQIHAKPAVLSFVAGGVEQEFYIDSNGCVSKLADTKLPKGMTFDEFLALAHKCTTRVYCRQLGIALRLRYVARKYKNDLPVMSFGRTGLPLEYFLQLRLDGKIVVKDGRSLEQYINDPRLVAKRAAQIESRGDVTPVNMVMLTEDQALFGLMGGVA